MSTFNEIGVEVSGEDHLSTLIDNSAAAGETIHPTTGANAVTEVHQEQLDTTTTADDDEKEAEAALDSILETSVAEVNLALSHDDAVTAAVNAAALDATNNVSLVDEMAVTAAAVAGIDAATVAATDIVHGSPDNGIQQIHATTIPTNPFTTDTSMADGTAAAPANLLLVNGGVSGTTTNLVLQQQQQQEQHQTVVVPSVKAAPAVASQPPQQQPNSRVGRWTLDEKILFLFGLQKFGKGHWKKISIYVPDRSLVQIKSHAQKIVKRLNSGEDVFRRLEENISRLHVLVKQIHEQRNLEIPTIVLQPNTYLSYMNGSKNSIEIGGASNKTNPSADGNKKKKGTDSIDDDGQRKRARTTGTTSTTNSSKDGTGSGTEHLAALALSQLASPEDEEGTVKNEDGTAVADTTNIDGTVTGATITANEEITKDVEQQQCPKKMEEDIDVGELIGV